MATTLFSLTKSGGIAISDNGMVSDLLNIDLIGPWLRILDLRIALNGLTHTFPDDLDFLLLAPGGANLEFWSDAGDNNDIVNGNFTIADSAASLLPDETPIVSGTYRPAGYGSLESAGNWGLPASFTVNHPAPGGTATLDSVFGGLFIGGNWTLIVRDDFTADAGSLASWGLQGTAAVIVKPDDFDGNFQSDILWQGSDGTPAVWLISGDHVVSVGAAGSFNPGPTWHVRDDGDFNGDARSDILWQNDDGAPAIWLMDHLNALSVGAAGPFNPGPSWQIKATGDFNFDTKADILWQGSDGTPAIWLMDGFNALFTRCGRPVQPGAELADQSDGRL